MIRPKPERRASVAPPNRLETRKLGLIGDVHTEHGMLLRAIDHLRSLHCDLLVCTGDIPDGAGTAADVDRCCKLLHAQKVLTILGNHDRWLLDDEMRDLPGATAREEVTASAFEYLTELPISVELSSPLGLALLCHGLADNDMAQVQHHERGRELERNETLQALLTEKRYRFILNGHTHRAGIIEVGPIVLINAGTLRRDRQPCCSTLDFERGEVTCYDIVLNAPAVARATLPITRA